MRYVAFIHNLLFSGCICILKGFPSLGQRHTNQGSIFSNKVKKCLISKPSPTLVENVKFFTAVIWKCDKKDKLS